MVGSFTPMIILFPKSESLFHLIILAFIANKFHPLLERIQQLFIIKAMAVGETHTFSKTMGVSGQNMMAGGHPMLYFKIA